MRPEEENNQLSSYASASARLDGVQCSQVVTVPKTGAATSGRQVGSSHDLSQFLKVYRHVHVTEKTAAPNLQNAVAIVHCIIRHYSNGNSEDMMHNINNRYLVLSSLHH